jgi:hypothetical protein
MAKNLGKELEKILEEDLAVVGAPFAFGADIEGQASRPDSKDIRRGPSFSEFSNSDGEKKEPEDKVLVAVQNCLINGDFEGANKLISAFNSTAENGQFFSQHHMNQLVDFVKKFDKYVKSDLDWNYYKADANNNPIDGAADLKKVKAKEDKVSALINDLWKDFQRQNRNG